MSNQPDDGPTELRTAADFIQEAARYVNWKPDQKHSEQARYDALRALNSIHAYSTTIALETLRRIDPDAAERVAKHLGRDDWDLYAENAWIWNDHLAKGEPIDPDGAVFPKLAGQTETPAPDNEHRPIGVRSTDVGAFIRCSCGSNPTPHYWLKAHWPGDKSEGERLVRELASAIGGGE